MQLYLFRKYFLIMSGLSIIIVNYKTPALVVQCLQTLGPAWKERGWEVIVVDNASGDNSEKIITTAFSSVKWIGMQYNAGFARANNEGIRQSSGEVVLLLNSDTLNEADAIVKCYDAFVASPYAACGLQLLNPDRSPQISGNFAMKGGLNYLLPLPFIGAVLKWLGNTMKVKKPNIPDATETTEVDWINGAFLMVKKEAIRVAGLMDEDFFLYAEEAEWCSRLKKAGKLCIFGQFSIVHLQGETSNEAFGSSGRGYANLFDRKGLQIMLSNLVRIRKEFGAGWYLFILLTYTLAVPVFFIGSFIENIFRLKNPFVDFGNAARFTGNVARLWRFAPVIISKKPFFYKVL